MIEPWPKVGSRPMGDYRIFTIRADRRVSPRTQREHEFYVIESAHWVNVVAITSNEELVMVEQFRHGSDTVELEVPGGVMDPGEESPLVTGVRELREETGYEGEDAEIIGEVYSNPAIMNNLTYTVLVKNCHRTSETEFDSGEDIVTRLVPLSEIPELVTRGRVKHSLVVAALFHYHLR